MRFVSMFTWLFFGAVIFYVLDDNWKDTTYVISRHKKTEIRLSQYGNFSRSNTMARLVFSQDGNQVCLWESKLTSDWNPSKWIVFSVKNGVFLTSSTNGTGKTEQPLLNFPFLTLNIRWGNYFTNTTAYAIQEGTQLALRAHPRPKEKYATLEEEERLSVPTVVMFRLGREPDILWKTKLTEATHSSIYCLAFLDSPNSVEKCVLAVCSHKTGYVLNQDTGKLLSSFTYGDTEPEKKTGWGSPFGRRDTNREIYGFTSTVFALDPSLRYLAVGGFFDRRLRIISLKDFSMVCEFHTNETPFWPWDGIWRMYNLDFSPSGKYLIAESMYGGRSVLRHRRVTEVIDVKNWKVIQKFDDMNTYSVAISPDDTQIAYIQNNVLKIVPFVPQKRPR